MRKLCLLLVLALIAQPTTAFAGGPQFSGDGSVYKALGGQVTNGSSATTGQVLTKQADGTLAFATTSVAAPALSAVLAVGNGSGANSISMASGQLVQWNSDSGIWRAAANLIAFGPSQGVSTGQLAFGSATINTGASGIDLGSSVIGKEQLASGGVIGFTSGNSNGTMDTGLSRGAAGEFDAGTGAAGSKAGGFKGSYVWNDVAGAPAGQGFTTTNAPFLSTSNASVYYVWSVSGPGATAITAPHASRGTTASPTALSSGDTASAILTYGHNGTTYNGLTELDARVDGAVGVAAPGMFVFSTQPSTGGGMLTKWALRASGNLSSNSANVLGWTASSTDPTAALDTGISRGGAVNTIAFGNGTAANATGLLQFSGAQLGGGTPTARTLSWNTGGTFTAVAPEILFPTDQGGFISAGTPASGGGNSITITASPGVTNAGSIGGSISVQAGNGITTGSGGGVNMTAGVSPTGTPGAVSLSGGANGGAADQNAGGVVVHSGASSGLGVGTILFKVPTPATSTGSGNNADATSLTLSATSQAPTATFMGVAGIGSTSQSANNPVLEVDQAWTNIGVFTYQGIVGRWSITAGAAGNILDLFGGASGTTSEFKVTNGGAATLNAGLTCTAITMTTGNITNATGGSYLFASRGGLTGIADGAFQFRNTAATGFTSLQYGANASGTDANSTSNTAFFTGAATGGGASGDFRFQTGTRTVDTGSAVQTLGDRVTVCGKDKLLSTTSATATTFATLSTVSLGGVSGTIYVTVETTNGTEISTAYDQFDFSASNKAGAITINSALIGTELVASSNIATLTTTAGVTVTSTGSTINLNVTPVFGGTAAGAVTKCKVSWTLITNGLTSVTTG